MLFSKHRLVTLILGLCFAAYLKAQVLGTSTQEYYNYRYIVELYDAGDSRTLSNEVYLFQTKYPNSSYMPYVRFIDANLAMESGNYIKAISMYDELLKLNLSRDVYAEIMINFAYSLSATGEYSQALSMLQRLDSEIGDPAYSAEATKIRADIYHKMGHYYSAAIAYREAIVHFPEESELRFGLFSCLVNTDNEVEALAMLWKEDPQSVAYPNFIRTWLSYLISTERYADFDDFVQNNVLGQIEGSQYLADLQIRKSLLVGDFDTIDSLLVKWGTPNNRFMLYSGLSLLNKGNITTADSIFQLIVTDPSPEVAIPAYIERLKILYRSEPLSAITQLSNYVQNAKSDARKGELLYTLGYFCYHKEDYPEAIKQLTHSKRYDLSIELNARIDILLAEAWFAVARYDIAKDSFNRYLNQYPQGSARDRALFYNGYIDFKNKDYISAKQSFNLLISSYPQSGYMQDALYYLGEMNFYLANYNYALDSYLSLAKRDPDNQQVALRIAQSYFYLADYTNCEKFLGDLYPNYESSILKGNLLLSQKNYTGAFDQFSLAESFTSDRLRKAEAQSYRALCLYQMKRFKEASALYLKLSNLGESPDTYLFLSAKSAYAASDYHQALILLDRFIDTYPDSQHFLSALNDIANTYYNMGNFNQAMNDWISILTRFRNHTQFDTMEQTVVRDALLGLELGLGRMQSSSIMEEILSMIDTFSSEYISFELSLLLLKSYARDAQWDDLIRSAESIRNEYPSRANEEINLLMANGFMALEQYPAADSLLFETYSKYKNNSTLVKWAELDILANDYRSAYDKYTIVYQDSSSYDIWIMLLECSSKLDYFEFNKLWDYRQSYPESVAHAQKYYLRYLYHDGRYQEAASLAEELLNTSLSQYDHALSFLISGLIELRKQDYPSAISTLNKTVVLFPEYKDIQSEAVVNLITGLHQSGASTESLMYFNKYKGFIDIASQRELQSILGLSE